MQQPPDQLLFLGLVVAVVLYPVLLGIHRRREGIRHQLRRYLIAVIAYLITAILLARNGTPPVAALIVGVLVGLGVESLLVKPRSRHIPKGERRKAIAHHERRTGRKFNPKTDEVDHDISFARLGSHTADNLSVLSRAENRRKGKKRVWWDVLGG